jgi:two-component sensor histidine kinase
VAETLPMESERCWRLALAVHELMTNAARHACFDGRDGAIRIELSPSDAAVNCIVADNGSLPTRLKPARGLQMVSDLVEGCPSSDDLRLVRRFVKGGSGSSGLEFKRLATDAASVG